MEERGWRRGDEGVIERSGWRRGGVDGGEERSGWRRGDRGDGMEERRWEDGEEKRVKERGGGLTTALLQYSWYSLAGISKLYAFDSFWRKDSTMDFSRATETQCL